VICHGAAITICNISRFEAENVEMRNFCLVVISLVWIWAFLGGLGIGEAVAEPYDDIDALRSKGTELYQAKKLPEAAVITQQALEQAEHRLGPDHAMTGTLLRNLAAIYLAQGKTDEAEALVVRAVAVIEKALGPEDQDLFAAVDMLARIRLSQKRAEEALSLFRRGLAILEKVLGPESPQLVAPLDGTAAALAGTRRLAETEPIYRRILSILEKTRGPDSIELTSWLDRLGKLYIALRRAREAERPFQRMVGIIERAKGPDHPDLLPPLRKLAEIHTLADQEQYPKAEELYNRSLAIAGRASGSEHLDLRQWHDALGELHMRQRRYGEAESQFQRSVTLVEINRGADHPDVAGALEKLAAVYTAFDRKEEMKAEPLYLRSLAIKSKAQGPDHPDLIPTLKALGSVYMFSKQTSQAEASYQRALSIAETAHRPDHPTVADVLDHLVTFYLSSQQKEINFDAPPKPREYAKAEPLALRALAIREKTASSNAFEIDRSLNSVASIYSLWSRHANAEPYYRRILTRRENESPVDALRLRMALENLGDNLREQGRLAEAEQIFLRLLQIVEREHGVDHIYSLSALQRLIALYQAQSRSADVAPLQRRILLMAERKNAAGERGPVTLDLSDAARDLGKTLQTLNRAEEAGAAFRQAVAHNEAAAPNDWSLFESLIDLANFLLHTSRFTGAEEVMRRAIEIAERNVGSSKVGEAFNELALLLQQTNQLAEAEALYRRALQVNMERGGLSSNISTLLNNLALLLSDTNRLDEAEHLLRRALAMAEEDFGTGHIETTSALSNLGSVLATAGQYQEAETLTRRSLAIVEQALGPDHAKVAVRLNNLGQTLNRTGRTTEAEPLLLRALAIEEKSFGPDHPHLTSSLTNLAHTLVLTGRLTQGEETARRALAIDEKIYGIAHPKALIALRNLAIVRGLMGDWPGVVGLYQRARAALIQRRSTVSLNDRVGLEKGPLGQNVHSQQLRQYARALYRIGAKSPASREEAFLLAQWAPQTEAANALAQMAARFGKGEGPMVALIRERQNLVASRQSQDKRLLAASAELDSSKIQALRDSISELDKRLEGIDVELAEKLPDYAELTNPKPLTIAEVQGMLNANEAMAFFMDLDDVSGLPGETLIWVVTRNAVRWRSVPLSTTALSESVAALRCGLDYTKWQERASAEKCRGVLKAVAGQARDGEAFSTLPFDLMRAHELYNTLFGPDRDLLEDKNLLIVPTGPLTSLPLGVLVKERPETAFPSDPAGYSRAAWLGATQPMSILPSVAGLKASRRIASNSSARLAYIGIGNPLLDGPDAASYGKQAQSAREKQQCAASGRSRIAGLSTGRGRNLNGLLRGSHADIEQIRQATPLPETADEICAVGERLSEGGATFLLGSKASETVLKDWSAKGRLAEHRIVHFATHGVLAGQVQNTTEPGLILTPPPKGTSGAEALERDDGYLGASEIAMLKLNADWVVLSACNTAGGANPEAEALSAKRMQWMMAKYASGIAEQKGLGIRFQVIVPKQMIGGTGVGDAGPPLTPALRELRRRPSCSASAHRCRQGFSAITC
jgi:tetratricopeptide (TPR) repeat protein